MTVEPGIYVEGLGGVRIEDMVLVTKTGQGSLTHSPKALIECEGRPICKKPLTKRPVWYRIKRKNT